VLVNRRGFETHGRPTVTSLTEIDEPVDVAYMMVPQAGTLDALTDAHAAGVRNAVILSSGYGEAGDAGRAAQAELVAHAEALDILVLGPNMLGFANFVDAIPLTSVPVPAQPAGPVALLSQSGASSSAMADFATMTGVGLSYLVTLGNEAMITAGHILDFLVDDEQTKAIAMFIESVRDPEEFRRAARRAADKGKAVVALKAGSSELSARTAAAHTGALVGDDRVIDAVFADLGIIRVDSIEDMLLTAGAAAHLGPIKRPGIGVVSISGGACDIIADRAADLGAPIPELAPETTAAIGEFFAAYGTIQNPLDVTGAAVIDPSIFTKAIGAMSQDPSIGVVAVVNSIPWESDGQPWFGAAIAKGIGDGIALAKDAPAVFVNQVLQPTTAYTKELMQEAGVPYVLPGLRSAVFALQRIGVWSQRIQDFTSSPSERPTPPVPAGSERRGAWSEDQARQLLVDAGIPVVPARLVTSPEEAAAAAAELDGPVALKIVSPDILHKSDIGGVRLGVQGGEAVRDAYAAVVAAAATVPAARVHGVLVSPMRAPATELLVGVVRDPQWGPMLAVALGGILVEVLGDSALSPLPVTPGTARRMLGSLRGAAVLHGVRGSAPADLDALADVVSHIGDLALALGDELVSLEVNPLRVDGSTIEALDVVVEWKDK
jgi:acyl-CoA synthetase (NDP forming)